MDWDHVTHLAADVVAKAQAAGVMIATAESCTGGLICGALTEIAGSSAVVDRGFVTYSNEAKQEMLGVSAETLAAHGAVSPQTAEAMAAGALERSNAHIAVSVTGIAGPGGGSANKPVGTVDFGLAVKGAETRTCRKQFATSERSAIRLATVEKALQLISNAIESSSKL